MASYDNLTSNLILSEFHQNTTDTSQVQSNLHLLEDSFKTVFLAFTILLILVGNCFSLRVIQISPLKFMGHATKVFMISLAVTDLCAGILMVPSVVSSAIGYWAFGSFLCKEIVDWVSCVGSMSVITLACMGIDRLVAVQKPLRYHQIMTRKRAVIVTVVLWIILFLFYSVPTTFHVQVEYRHSMTYCMYKVTSDNLVLVVLAVLISFTIPTIVATLIYIKLLFVSTKQISRIKLDIRRFGPRPNLRGSILMYVVVFLGTNIAWSPFIAITAYEAWTESRAPAWCEFSAHCLLISNSWWNIVIYTLTSKTWKKCAIKVLKDICGRFK